LNKRRMPEYIKKTIKIPGGRRKGVNIFFRINIFDSIVKVFFYKKVFLRFSHIYVVLIIIIFIMICQSIFSYLTAGLKDIRIGNI